MRRPSGLKQDHPQQRAVRRAHRLERSEIAQVIEREVVKRLPRDRDADDETERDRGQKLIGMPVYFRKYLNVSFLNSSRRVGVQAECPSMRSQTRQIVARLGFREDEGQAACAPCGAIVVARE